MSITLSHPTATAAPIGSHTAPMTESSRSSESIDGKADKNVNPGLTRKHSVDRSASTKRWRTFIRSFKHIYNLTPKEIEDFMNSYQIYENDWADEEKMISTLGIDYQQRVGDSLRAYYSVLNHLCSLGDVEKMYIPPVMDKKASVLDNQLLNEEEIAKEIGLKPSMKVLDLGCGRGRVAAHMSSYTGAEVTGLNIDENQIEQARQWNESLGFMNKFVVHDQNNLPLPFESESFDAFYEIQALSLCKDPSLLFKEIHRILKPGAKFLLLDWVSLPPYDPTDPTHASLMRRVKPLIGAVGTPTPVSFEKALIEAGFTIIKSDNPSIDGRQAALIDKVDFYFRSLRRMIHGLVHLHALPPHFTTLIDRFCLDGEAFEKMDEMGLITTTYRIVAQKV